MPGAAEPGPGRLPAFVSGVALWSGAMGMQAVLFSWLVVGVLGAGPERTGLVQTAHAAPVLLLLLPGGALADRFDRRRLLVVLHLLTGALGMALSLVVAAGRLELGLLVAYAVAMGSLTAFVLPARDAFLSDVSGGDLMRAATALTLAQFGAQAAGTLAAGSARLIGVDTALAIQAGLLWLGVVAAWRLPRPAPRHAAAAGRPGLRQVGAGLLVVLRSPILRSTLLLMSGVGLFFAGAWFVTLPLTVREHWRGDVGELSLFMTVLQLGTVLGATGLLWRGAFPRRGRALVLSLAAGGLPLLALAGGPGFRAGLVAAFAWGLCVALFQSISRAVIQEHAPEAERARVLSVYSLAVMGAGVVGSPVAGWLAERVGALGAFGVAALALWAFVAALALGTPVWRID